MDLSELNGDEKLVFAALVRHLINVDEVLTIKEMQAARRIQTLLADTWGELAQKATRTYRTVDDALEGAGTIARDDARELIYHELLKLAAADEVDDSEVHLLERLAGVWGLGDETG